MSKLKDTFRPLMPQRIKNLYHLLTAYLANLYYGFPGNDLKLIGVTGTKGKTTTTLMIYHILKETGKKAGYITSISAKIGEKELDTGFHVTTPDPQDIPRFLKQMKEAGIEYVVLETTSQGLEQNRTATLRFDSAVFTNIASDHLDYHKTWESYAGAKAKLIEQLKPDKAAILNKGDGSFEFLKEYCKNRNKKFLTYSTKQRANLKAENIKSSLDGVSCDILVGDTSTCRLLLKLIGIYNIPNALASISSALSLGVKLEEAVKALSTFKSPPGHMEVVQKKPFTIIIDFAHTSDSLEQALQTLKGLTFSAGDTSTCRLPGGRIISVFGCASERDRERRKMGEVAARLGHILVLTAEDSRKESLKGINNEILDHAKKSGGKLIQRFMSLESVNYDKIKKKIDKSLKQGQKPVFCFDKETVESRQDAIEFAIKIAEPNDIVFITGKGHEKSLCFGDTEYPWSDQEAVSKTLNPKS